MESLSEISLLNLTLTLVGGFLAGIINTLAGNGSAITLTLLTEVLGVPGVVANATNRVGVFTQSTAGIVGFSQGGKLEWKRGKLIIGLTIAGALVGAYVSTLLSNEEFRQVFRYLLLGMLVVILIRPKKWLREHSDPLKLPLLVGIPVFLVLGFYGGFIQMGFGVFFLAVAVLLARYNLTEANGLKLLVTAVYTLPILLYFHYRGLIDWPIGLLLAVGQTTGGYLTARFAVRSPQANLWAYRILVIMVVVAILRMFDIF